jgi:hypothetical protein
MAKKLRKKQVDRELLEAIFSLEQEWKQIQDYSKNSIERTFESRAREQLAQAKYLYLLKEARRRKVNALPE